MENKDFFEASDISFENLFPEDTPVSTVNDKIDAVEDKLPVEPKEGVLDIKEEPKDNYSKYNDLALAATYLKEKGLLELDVIDKLSPEEFALSIEKQRQKESEGFRNLILEQAGEYKNYFQLKLNGIDQEVIDDIANDTLISKLKIDIDPTEASNTELVNQIDNNREKMIIQELAYRGLPEKDYPFIIEKYKNEGRLAERALESKKFFEDEETARTSWEIDQKKLRDQQELEIRQSYYNDVNKYITNKKIAGYELNNDEAEQLKKFIFESNAVIEVQDQNGRKVAERTSEYNKRRLESQNNTEAELAYAFWLMKGGTFIPMKAQGKEEQHNAIIQEMRRRSAPQKVEEEHDDINELLNYR